MGQCYSKRAVVSDMEQHKHQELLWEQRLLGSILMGDLPRVRMVLLEAQQQQQQHNNNKENDQVSIMTNSNFCRDINQPVTVNAGRKVPLLHYAAGAGQLAIAQYLVNSCQADINVQDAAGWTPLHYACHRGRLDVARWLVLHTSAVVDSRDLNGETALHKLASCGKIQAAAAAPADDSSSRDMFALLRLLIEDGAADARVVNHDGHTLLDLLQQQNAHSSTARVLGWIKSQSMADSYADFAESDYELESNPNTETSCAYTALTLSRYHVDLEEECDELKHWYDITTTVASDSDELDEDNRPIKQMEAPKEAKITLSDWITYLKPMTLQTRGGGDTTKVQVALTPDTSLDEDEDFLHELDNSFLLGDMVEI